MLISEIVKRLEGYKKKYGDLDVKSWDREWEEDSSIDELGVIENNGNPFVRLITEND